MSASAFQLGEYQVEGEIARGSCGVVFRARTAGGRAVAIKLLHEMTGLEAGDLKRFRREAEAIAHLRHPGIVALLGAGQHHGVPYLVMELLDGRSLAERIKSDGPLGQAEAIRVGIVVADALAYAHQERVIHRDVKPSNVVFDGQDVPRLTDFGLAKMLDSHVTLTDTGLVIGTPAFMAPEQALAEHERVGPPADVYGLGATLFVALTGRAPFVGPPLRVLDMVPLVPPPVPRRLRPELDPGLEAVVLRCLEKRPEDRFSSAAALATALRALAITG